MRAKRQRIPGATMAVLVVDGSRVRERVRRELERVRQQVERERELLQRFEAKDRPAFDRWYFGQFGALLTELRTIQQQLSLKMRLLFEIRLEMDFGRVSAARAYERVMAQQEREERETGKTDPNEESEAARGDGEERKRDKRQRGERNNRENGGPTEPKPAASQRLKALYRMLVRRLHPDSGGEDTFKRREWWLQVQQAYQDRDLDRLEVIAGMLDFEETGAGAATISGMLRLTKELRRTLSKLRSQIALKRKDPAWDFGQRKDLRKTSGMLREELCEKLAEFQSALRELDQTIESFHGRSGRW